MSDRDTDRMDRQNAHAVASAQRAWETPEDEGPWYCDRCGDPQSPDANHFRRWRDGGDSVGVLCCDCAAIMDRDDISTRCDECDIIITEETGGPVLDDGGDVLCGYCADPGTETDNRLNEED